MQIFVHANKKRKSQKNGKKKKFQLVVGPLVWLLERSTFFQFQISLWLFINKTDNLTLPLQYC